MRNLVDNKCCTGCQACVNACPRGAISMSENEEGFYFPKIDENKCISCGLCEKSCPAMRPLKRTVANQKVYAVVSLLDQNLSSSGGAFSVFARYVISKGGAVFGATMDESLRVKHVCIESVEELPKLRGSKYVHSYVGKAFQMARHFLKSGRPVLFTGTPCQIAGLYSYLGTNRYDGLLITLDLVCHGVPGQTFFDAYISKLQKLVRSGKKISSFRFRKLDAWDYRPAYSLDDEKKWKVVRLEKNAYMEAFFKGLSYRENCYQCQYANLDRVGTFTIADFWGIGTHGVKFSHRIGSGVSAVIDNCGLMPSLKAELEKYSYIEERPVEEVVMDNHNLKGAVSRPENREQAIADMLDPHISLYTYAKKYGMLPKNKFKYWIVESFKTIIYSIGLYNFYKAILYRVK